MVASLITSRRNTSGGFPEWSAWIESKIALQSVGRDGKGSSGRQETMKACGKNQYSPYHRSLKSYQGKQTAATKNTFSG